MAPMEFITSTFCCFFLFFFFCFLCWKKKRCRANESFFVCLFVPVIKVKSGKNNRAQPNPRTFFALHQNKFFFHVRDDSVTPSPKKKKMLLEKTSIAFDPTPSRWPCPSSGTEGD